MEKETEEPPPTESPRARRRRHQATLEEPRPAHAYGLPRGLIIILGLAAGVVVAAGMRAIPDIIGPVFMALVLTITVNPIRGWMIRQRRAGRLASLAVFLGVSRSSSGCSWPRSSGSSNWSP